MNDALIAGIAAQIVDSLTDQEVTRALNDPSYRVALIRQAVADYQAP